MSKLKLMLYVKVKVRLYADWVHYYFMLHNDGGYGMLVFVVGVIDHLAHRLFGNLNEVALLSMR